MSNPKNAAVLVRPPHTKKTLIDQGLFVYIIYSIFLAPFCKLLNIL